MPTTSGESQLRVLGAGLRPAALWYVGVAVVLGVVATTLDEVAARGIERLVPPGLGGLGVAGGAALLLVPTRGARSALKVIGAILLAEGGLAVFLATVRISSAVPHTTAFASLSLVKTAILVAMINAGRRWGPALAALIASGCTTVVCLTVGGALGYRYGLDVPELAALLIVLLGTIGFDLARRAEHRARRAYLAARDEDALRQTLGIARSRTAAIVHDTVLNDLAVLATSPPGPLGAPLVARLSATLDLLGSPDWTGGHADEDGSGPSAIEEAIARARADGLHVTVSGRPDVTAALPGTTAAALAAAIGQCLANVHRHAGTGTAEVTVLPEDGAVSVLVVDEGAGFDPAHVGPDRLGVAGSVLGRIEGVGGSARIFAQPGQGTAVLLTVPFGDVTG